jgi:hypothetical protein
LKPWRRHSYSFVWPPLSGALR